MPNPKTGTVTDDTAKAVRECKAGRVEFKLDKAANLHVPCGKFSFKPEDIEANGRAVIESDRAQPSCHRQGPVHRDRDPVIDVLARHPHRYHAVPERLNWRNNRNNPTTEFK